MNVHDIKPEYLIAIKTCMEFKNYVYELKIYNVTIIPKAEK